ncbi:MAG: alpha/beta hydrolase [Gluconacetobacter sp.]
MSIRLWRNALLLSAVVLIAPSAWAGAAGTEPAGGLPARRPAADPVSNARLFTLVLGDGARQRVLFSAPPDARGTLVMLPGGSGQIGLEDDGQIRHGDNFVVRTRTLWLRRGYAVLLADAVDGMNLRGLRSSPRYAAVVEALVDFAHAHMAGPVFLLGTSQGAIAAMNGAAHAPTGRVAGVVLTESVSVMGGSRETVFSADPGQVRIPVLIVGNRDDRCNVAPPGAAPDIAAALDHSPDVRVLSVSGGQTRSRKNCGSLTPHGYYGIEVPTVDAIIRWLDGHR